MPIFRYFVFMGGLLLALLVAADRYLPAPVAQAGASDPDRTIIRIASARMLPEKIVFDTRTHTDVPKIDQGDAALEEPEQQREITPATPAATSDKIRKNPGWQVSGEFRPRAKRVAKRSQRRAPDRRIALERPDPFSSGW